jgi:hypothetical protein
MKFNNYITDNYNNNISNDIVDYIGGSVNTFNCSCLCIFVIFIILIYVLQNSNVFKESFSTYNKTIDPNLVNNPNIVFDRVSKFKKKTYDSNVNFSNGCDDECLFLKNNIDNTQLPTDVNNAELGLHKWIYEGYGESDNGPLHGEHYDYKCNRPEFIDDKLNNTMLGRVWSYNHNNCDSIKVSQNKWDFNTGIVGDKGSNDSIILPFRSLPEHKVVEKFENQSSLTYNVGKCSDREDIVGFDQTSKCCFRDNEKASMFQNLNENNLGNAMKLLDYAAGDVHHENLNNSTYDDLQEISSLSNEGCPFP